MPKAAAILGIVYGKTDRRIRQIISLETEAQLKAVVLKSDELMMRVSRSLYGNHRSQDDLARTLGLTPER